MHLLYYGSITTPFASVDEIVTAQVEYSASYEVIERTIFIINYFFRDLIDYVDTTSN